MPRSTTSSRRQKEKEDRKEAILAAAREVFFEQGIRRATVEAVAARAEVAKGTVYLYFESKETILAHLLLEGLNQLVGRLQAAYAARRSLSAEARLRQIVINLLGNALKFTERDEVRVHVCRLHPANDPPDRSTSLSAVSPGGEGFLEVAVSDTGVGIPSESLGTIFEEFRQVEGRPQAQQGTGLGLAITKKLTELLGGTISVESEVGKGSVFTVRIPSTYREKRDEDIHRGD